ncbi:hypothetical protein AAFF_G00083950 [Aldrovandia affinis]|uniref:Uncharacterized protein n=1 Tax=Aldrovandia affinis TaxID=143900 RepID=A0AAD7RX55_9TELE|nr:hypothetical protein AAFF_G00083950 [Aldrovandia affinis]
MKRLKSQLLDAVIKSMGSRFKDLENDKILQAATRLVDPREWPAEEADLASYGADHFRVITDHFADILDWVGCDRGQARHQE